MIARSRFLDASLRASVAQAAAFGFACTVAVAVVVSWGTAAGAAYTLITAALFAAMMAVVAAAIGGQHPFPRFGPANCVTMLRAMALALVAGLIGQPGTAVVLWFVVSLTALAAVLDGFDGWFARRSGMTSAFGARFDLETDTALIMVLSILVWQYGKAGWWVLLSGLLRYIFVLAGWILPWLRRPLRPTWRGKTIAITQLVVLICAVAPIIPVWLSSSAAAIALAALGWSFGLDVLRLSRLDRTQ